MPVDEENAPEGAAVEGVLAEGREVRGHERHRNDDEAGIDGAKLSIETLLRILKEVCERLNLPKSGGKNKVLNRLRCCKAPADIKSKSATLTSSKLLSSPVLFNKSYMQSLTSISLPWWQACVLGRSRQSRHERKDDRRTATSSRRREDPSSRSTTATRSLEREPKLKTMRRRSSDSREKELKLKIELNHRRKGQTTGTSSA